jgi:hypothetical protein
VLLKKLFNVWLDEIQVRDRRAIGLDELARYPLFTAEFLAFLRTALPAHRHRELVHAVVVTARKPAGTPAPTRCPACGHDNALAARFCNQCGTRLAGAGGPVAAPDAAPDYAVHALLDAGAGGCEEGALLRLRELISGLARGQVLEVRSTDPGVREDLPAWCRMTGHEYLGAKGPRYFVRRS